MDPIKNVFTPSTFPAHNPEKDRNPDQISFMDTLKSLVSEVDNQIKDANQMAEEFALGKEHDLHEIMIASEKADLSFRFLMQIRNKLLEAYQEIMRMNF